MNIKMIVRNSLLVGVLGFYAGCIKYHDLVKSEFPQCKTQPDQHEVAYRYRRSVTVYDVYQTKAIFNALWLSDQVRTAYVDVYGGKRGMDEQAKEEMLKRLLEENKHWLNFYVLAEVGDKTYTSLSEKYAAWTLYVMIDNDKKIMPESIKEVDLEPEYQLMFAKTFNPFKTAYLVKFPLKGELADRYAKGMIKNIQMIVSSTYKERAMVWDMNEIAQTKKVLKDEDFYWC
jgi:hypothetical protein